MDINGATPAAVLNAQFKAEREANLAATAKQRKTSVNVSGAKAPPARPGGKPTGNGSFSRSGGKKD